MVIPNITMTFAHRPPETGSLENQFFIVKNYFLIVPDDRTCQVGHGNLFFIYISVFLKDAYRYFLFHKLKISVCILQKHICIDKK